MTESNLGVVIRQLRTAQNKTLTELAEATGTSASYLRQLERWMKQDQDEMVRVSDNWDEDDGYRYAMRESASTLDYRLDDLRKIIATVESHLDDIRRNEPRPPEPGQLPLDLS